MTKQLIVISNNKPEGERRVVPTPEDKSRHFRNVIGSVLEDAQGTWAEIWKEFQMGNGLIVPPEVEKGFKPECGWPEFLEKMWLLKHYLDYAKRFSEGRV